MGRDPCLSSCVLMGRSRKRGSLFSLNGYAVKIQAPKKNKGENKTSTSYTVTLLLNFKVRHKRETI